ncbi:MAG TPA: thiol:disulfide interchange protein DsbA/DsbL [Usitatibacter sp.]|nr:thiol:disulfide interchange protein DsbA/DsbL [Usitatibacter sp.]
MSLRKILAIAAAAAAFAAPAAFAQNPYATLNPVQPTEAPGKIEVIEFFWYGCPHCYSLEPSVNGFLKNVPKDVVFRRIPAVPSDAWGEAAKIFYTLEALGQLDKLHGKVFDAMHQERLNLNNKKIREEWLAKNGVDVAKYNEMEKSFSVATKLAKAKQLTYAYKVDSVPRLVVNGKYYTGPETAGGTQNMFPVVEQLLTMARKEK